MLPRMHDDDDNEDTDGRFDGEDDDVLLRRMHDDDDDEDTDGRFDGEDDDVADLSH